MTPAPRVSVLMAAYNGGPFIAEAVRSILGQSMGDLELVVVDDGSTDDTARVVEGFRDPRIRLVRNERNLGLAATRNRLLDLARGEYLAIMDCDDSSRPDRLARQVSLLDRDPGVGACGSWVEVQGRRRRLQKYPASHEEILCRFLFGMVFAHPSVVLRRRALEEHGLRYDPAFPPVEDYELLSRLIRVSRAANVPRPLVRYRVHEQQVSARKAEDASRNARAVRERQIRALGLDPTPEDLERHELLCLSGRPRGLSPATVEEVRRWLERVREANRERRLYPEPELSRLLLHRWFRLCAAAHVDGLPGARLFGGSDLARSAPLPRRAWYRLRIAARRRLASP